MRSHTRQYSAQGSMFDSFIGHSTSTVVPKRNHTIYVGKVSKGVRGCESLCHLPRYRSRAIHGGDDRNIVPRTDSSVGSDKALKGWPSHESWPRWRIGSESFQIDFMFASKIVAINMIAMLDSLASIPDRPSILENRLAFVRRAKAYLMAGRNRLPSRNGQAPAHR